MSPRFDTNKPHAMYSDFHYDISNAPLREHHVIQDFACPGVNKNKLRVVGVY